MPGIAPPAAFTSPKQSFIRCQMVACAFVDFCPCFSNILLRFFHKESTSRTFPSALTFSFGHIMILSQKMGWYYWKITRYYHYIHKEEAIFITSRWKNQRRKSSGDMSRGKWIKINRFLLVFPKNGHTFPSPAIFDFLAGHDFTVRIQTYLDSGALYRQLSFSSQKTSRTNLRAVNARARLCWCLFTSWYLRW